MGTFRNYISQFYLSIRLVNRCGGGYVFLNKVNNMKEHEEIKLIKETVVNIVEKTDGPKEALNVLFASIMFIFDRAREHDLMDINPENGSLAISGGDENMTFELHIKETAPENKLRIQKIKAELLENEKQSSVEQFNEGLDKLATLNPELASLLRAKLQ